MAKDSHPARSRTGHGPCKAKPRADMPGAAAPCSARSTASRSQVDRDPLKPVTKLHKDSGHPISKRTRKKDPEATHQKCFNVMTDIQEEVQKLIAERDEERANNSQLMQQLRAEKAQETSKLQQAITAREKVLAESQRLGRELCQLQQQLESTNANMQDQVSWNDIQPVLHQTHGDLVSATTRFWNTIDAFQNKRLASYLPGSGVIQGNWHDQSGPLGTLSHNTLPAFSGPIDLPHQAPASANQYGSLV